MGAVAEAHSDQAVALSASFFRGSACVAKLSVVNLTGSKVTKLSFAAKLSFVILLGVSQQSTVV